MKILGADVIGLEAAVRKSNTGLYKGAIVIDLSDLAIVSFNPTGDDGHYGWYPGVVELHWTGFPDFNKASLDEIKLLIAAHFLTLRASDIEPEDYTYELAFAGTGLGRGESLMELYRSHLQLLKSKYDRTLSSRKEAI